MSSLRLHRARRRRRRRPARRCGLRRRRLGHSGQPQPRGRPASALSASGWASATSVPCMGVPPVRTTHSAWPGGWLRCSAGKDTTVGHWEHMGLVTARPFPTYPGAFPEESSRRSSERIGRRSARQQACLRHGDHRRAGRGAPGQRQPDRLHVGRQRVPDRRSRGRGAARAALSWCQIARELLQGRHAVARVIARPFAGTAGAFVRTKDRRDFSLAASGPLYLDLLGRGAAYPCSPWARSARSSPGEG